MPQKNGLGRGSERPARPEKTEVPLTHKAYHSQQIKSSDNCSSITFCQTRLNNEVVKMALFKAIFYASVCNLSKLLDKILFLTIMALSIKFDT